MIFNVQNARFALGEAVTMKIEGKFEGEIVTVRKKLWVWGVGLQYVGGQCCRNRPVYHLGDNPDAIGEKFLYTDVQADQLTAGHQ